MTCRPFPPVHLSEDSRPFFSQALSKVLRAEFQRFKGNVRSRIKIEDHAVRAIDRVDRGTPGMKFNGAHLNHFQQSFFVLNVEVFVRLALVLEFK